MKLTAEVIPLQPMPSCQSASLSLSISPAVTPEDDGTVLGVADGKWQPVPGGGGGDSNIYIAAVNDRTIIKGTFAEIKSCADTGMPYIILRLNNRTWEIQEINEISDFGIVYDNWGYSWNPDDTIYYTD